MASISNLVSHAVSVAVFRTVMCLIQRSFPFNFIILYIIHADSNLCATAALFKVKHL